MSCRPAIYLNGNPAAPLSLPIAPKHWPRPLNILYCSSIGLNYLDGVTTSGVASSESWNRIRSGLRVFWQGPYPPLSGR